ncbi:MAG TPA: hypothetical protein VLR91_04460, partial [Thermodesulfobacteriota bacterium]|nr:hypothetical protein [Thermodesulfobacteriota bacterium]
SRNVAASRRILCDPEKTSLWQALSYGISNKSSYCLTVCPAGEEVIGPFLDNRQGYQAEVVKPFQNKEESIYVGSLVHAKDKRRRTMKYSVFPEKIHCLLHFSFGEDNE